MVKDEVIKPCLENPHEELPQTLGEATPCQLQKNSTPGVSRVESAELGSLWVINAGGISGLGTVKEAISLG